MCTLSWTARGVGYDVFFNRDERLTRGPETAPAAFATAGTRWVAPTDGDAGGTWILVNELGLTLCLLNGYQAHEPDDARSRGLLVSDLADSADTGALEARTRAALARDTYRSFVLVGFAPGAAPRALTWDGAQLDVRELTGADRPIASSGVDAAGARAARRAALAQLTEVSGLTGSHDVDADVLAAFHASHLPERGPLSACMHRADAATRSQVHVRVDADASVLVWTPGAPCEAGRTGAAADPRTLTLARRAPNAAPTPG